MYPVELPSYWLWMPASRSIYVGFILRFQQFEFTVSSSCLQVSINNLKHLLSKSSDSLCHIIFTVWNSWAMNLAKTAEPFRESCQHSYHQTSWTHSRILTSRVCARQQAASGCNHRPRHKWQSGFAVTESVARTKLALRQKCFTFSKHSFWWMKEAIFTSISPQKQSGCTCQGRSDFPHHFLLAAASRKLIHSLLYCWDQVEKVSQFVVF